MNRRRARRHDQAAIRGTREGRDGALDLAGVVAYVDRAYIHADRWRHGLDDGELADPGRYRGISKDRRPRHARRNLLEQFDPFRTQTVFEQHKAGGVAARPRQTIDEAGADWIAGGREHDRHCPGRLEHWPRSTAHGQDDIRRERDQFRRVFARVFDSACGPAIISPHVAAIDPAQLLQALLERLSLGLSYRIVSGPAHDHANPPHPLRLLRACRERPRDCTTEKRDELTPLHSITSSAMASSDGGTVRPNIRAVSALMTSSNFVACTTGKSAGFSPLRIRPA